jgi:hypothetical protein
MFMDMIDKYSAANHPIFNLGGPCSTARCEGVILSGLHRKIRFPFSVAVFPSPQCCTGDLEG